MIVHETGKSTIGMSPMDPASHRDVDDQPRSQGQAGRAGSIRRTMGMCIFVAACICASAVAASTRSPHRPIHHKPFDLVQLRVEYDVATRDVGVQLFLDAASWQDVRILDPRGIEVFKATIAGALLRRGGGRELFLESDAPAVDHMPLDDFLRVFPEGDYAFIGRATDGRRLVTRVGLSHAVPAAPEIVAPVGEMRCARDVGNPVAIAWRPVTRSLQGSLIDIIAYQIRIEHDVTVFNARLPANEGTSVTVPPELLATRTSYAFEVVAIAKGGNQTVSRGCFVTAPDASAATQRLLGERLATDV